MLNKLRLKIESKRNSNNFFWLFTIKTKDILYRVFRTLKSILDTIYFRYKKIENRKIYCFVTRNELLRLLSHNLIIAELGVFKGDFSEIILNVCKPRELHLIDTWEGKMLSGNKDGEEVVEIDDMNIVFNEMKTKYLNSNNVILHRGDTVSIIKNFPDDYFDAVYIDSSHTYNQTIQELEICRIKVKNGGYILGHDYAIQTIGVFHAVNKFCKKYNYRIKFLSQDGCPSFFIINSKK